MSKVNKVIYDQLREDLLTVLVAQEYGVSYGRAIELQEQGQSCLLQTGCVPGASTVFVLPSGERVGTLLHGLAEGEKTRRQLQLEFDAATKQLADTKALLADAEARLAAKDALLGKRNGFASVCRKVQRFFGSPVSRSLV